MLCTPVAKASTVPATPHNCCTLPPPLHCSPCLKLKPVTKSTKSGYLMVNIETYGGGLWYTWFDRDLGLAGRWEGGRGRD